MKFPIKFKSKREQALFELVDGCYTLVELWRPDSPAQEVWKKEWLKKAKKYCPQEIFEW